MPYLDGDTWLDGPKLYAWIDARLRKLGVTPSSNLLRRMSDWRRGARANIYSLDGFLPEVDAHPIELPDDLWAEDQTWHRGNNHMRSRRK